MSEPAALLARRAATIERRLGPEVLVVRAGEVVVHRLTGPAALVWEALARPGSEDDVLARLRDTAPRGTDVASVVRAALPLLHRHGLLQVTGP